MSTALLVIDVQVNMFDPQPVYQGATSLQTIRGLIDRARVAGVLVVYVQHGGGAGEPDEPGTPGWAIHPNVAPLPGEPVVQKRTPNAFHQTNLSSVLAERGIRRLVLAGMQTEFCIDTTCRHAWSLGYEVVLAADAHSTYDGVVAAAQVIAHTNQVLSFFSAVLPAADIVLEAESALTLQEPLGVHDVAAIRSGLAEVAVYEKWLINGEGTPFWPHTHPIRVADTLRRLYEPGFAGRREMQPAGWEAGMAQTFFQPLTNMPEFARKTAVLAINQAIDHLLQSPINSFAPQIRKLTDDLWSYDAREFRLIYSPRAVEDKNGRKRKYVFLIWLAPALPQHNPFA